jgi:hypothetical protein
MMDADMLLTVIGDLEVERRRAIATIQALSPPADDDLIRQVEDSYETPVGCTTKITLQADGTVEIVTRSATTGRTSQVVVGAKGESEANKPRPRGKNATI